MLCFEQLKNARLFLSEECSFIHCRSKKVKVVCTSYYVEAANPAIGSYCQNCINEYLIKGYQILDDKDMFTLRILGKI